MRFNASKANDYTYTCLTDGKIYEVEETIEWPDEDNEGETQRYMLYEDDYDEQVPYDTRIFDVVEQ